MGDLSQLPLLSDDSHDQIDLESNSSELPSDHAMCRICFENDPINQMFRPCLCKGDQRYVHSDCLNQWRATSPNQEAFSRCLTCQYEYKMEIEPNVTTTCGQINQVLAGNACFLCPLIVSIIFIGGLIVRSLDPKRVIVNFFQENIYNPHVSASNDYFYYYVFISYVYLILIGIIFIVNVIRMKNRRMYLKYCLGHNWICGIVRLLTMVTLTVMSFYLNLYIGCILMTIEIQIMIRLHYTFLNYLYRANYNKIIPYIENE